MKCVAVKKQRVLQNINLRYDYHDLALLRAFDPASLIFM